LVKKLLGHKRVENTKKCIGMIDFKDDEFEVTTAINVEETKKGGCAGCGDVSTAFENTSLPPSFWLPGQIKMTLLAS
jgi:hypothetical protein